MTNGFESGRDLCHQRSCPTVSSEVAFWVLHLFVEIQDIISEQIARQSEWLYVTYATKDTCSSILAIL